MTRRKTQEEFEKQINEKYNGEFTVLGEYINSQTKIKVRHNCKKCNNYEYEVRPNDILRGNRCPKCFGTQKKTTEQFKREIKKKYGDKYTILGQYINTHKKILIRHNCDKCNNYEWMIIPKALLKGTGCPVCSGREVKLGINTIYDTDKWMVDLGVSVEDAKIYKSQSGKKITVKCPDCGRKKDMIIADVYNYKSICCSCGDGKSYPEKFMMNVLDQLKVDYEIEYSPKWIKPKRYDFYISSLNCIIETHGIQHYNRSFEGAGGRNTKQEQKNDKYKKETALQNGIEHYITIDCSKSNLDYIRNSIINSDLIKLFDLSKIDWLECAKFANKNIVKEVCEYWNNRKEKESTVNLSQIFRLSKSVIIKYLKRGYKLGWCNYDSKEEMRKSALKNGKSNCKRVEIFKNNISLGIFDSCSELARQSKRLFGVKLNNSNISSVCTGKRKRYKEYTFKYI